MITSPKYSFIQFGQEDTPCCNGATTICLPIYTNNDLQFQVISDSAPGSLQVVKENGDVVSSQSGFVDLGDNYYAWASPIDFTGLANNECFQLKIGTALSNCFRKIVDDCYTSILEYYNDEDYAEFIYCNAEFTNKVRIPFHLYKPKINEDRTVYKKSNGAIKLTKSLITKEYVLTTDFMPEEMHDAFAVAMAHDYVNAYTSSYSGGISKNGDYSPEWEEGMCVAPVEFKVEVTPLAIRNNNCQECEEEIECVGVSIPSLSLPDAPTGIAYSHTVALGGTAPFTLSNIVKPSWMHIALSGSNVVFSGTPVEANAGTGITVSFDAANDCGTDSESDTINVVVPSCEAVAIVDTPALPDAHESVAYSYSFTLSGDSPFTLSAVVKPSWMAISISRSTVNFSGTPSSENVGTGIAVSFTISNCGGEGTVHFDDALDVIAVTEVNGIIDFTAHGMFVASLSPTIPCNVDLEFQATYDDDGTPTDITSSVHIDADASSGATDGALIGTGVWTCIKPSISGGSTIVQDILCGGQIYRVTLEIPEGEAC
jgi:hypothetical protein